MQEQFTPLRIENLDASNPIMQVSASNGHVLAVAKSGQVFSWGSGEYFRLGHGDTMDLVCPKRIEHGGFDNLFVVSVSAGECHSAAIDSSGHVYIWGYGNSGRLGHGVESNQPTPRFVAGLEGFRVVQVVARSVKTFALADNGVVHSFGYDPHRTVGLEGGGLGLKVLTPESLEVALQGRKVAAIATGYEGC